MDDDVEQAFVKVHERIKKLETALKDEVDERVQLNANYTETDNQVTTIRKSLGAWLSGSISKKIDDIDKRADGVDKRLDAIDKRLKK